jgi:hypothetical protein
MCTYHTIRGFRRAPDWVLDRLREGGWVSPSYRECKLWVGLKSYIDPITNARRVRDYDDYEGGVHAEQQNPPSRIVLSACRKAPLAIAARHGPFALVFAEASVQDAEYILYDNGYHVVRQQRITFAHVAPASPPISLELATAGSLYLNATTVLPVVFDAYHIDQVGVHTLHTDYEGNPTDHRNVITVRCYWLPTDVGVATELLVACGHAERITYEWVDRAINIVICLRYELEDLGIDSHLHTPTAVMTAHRSAVA